VQSSCSDGFGILFNKNCSSTQQNLLMVLTNTVTIMYIGSWDFCQAASTHLGNIAMQYSYKSISKSKQHAKFPYRLWPPKQRAGSVCDLATLNTFEMWRSSCSVDGAKDFIFLEADSHDMRKEVCL
jgi:hypothetical protein